MTAADTPSPSVLFVGAVSPLVVGAAPFNDALFDALAQRARTTVVSWRNMYPPLLYRRAQVDPNLARNPRASFSLSFGNPMSWRRLAKSGEAYDALVLPWLHPAMAVPYRYLLARVPADVKLMICHNVLPHEPSRYAPRVVANVLRHADALVIHAAEQGAQLEDLRIDRPVIQAFHPRFPVRPATDADRAASLAVRTELGNPRLLLLSFGAVRPYKGVDVAIEALAHLPASLDAKLLVAGKIWSGGPALRARVEKLGLRDKVAFRDDYISDRDTAALFAAADIVLLPYRTASQSGVVQLAFAHGVPVIASAVGGLPEAIRDGVDGLLCPPGDHRALAQAIARMATRLGAFRAAIDRYPERMSFSRYADLLLTAVDDLRQRSGSRSAIG